MLNIAMPTHLNFLQPTSITGILYSASFRDLGQRLMGGWVRIRAGTRWNIRLSFWSDEEHGRTKSGVCY